jgi:hypothetical protein
MDPGSFEIALLESLGTSIISTITYKVQELRIVVHTFFNFSFSAFSSFSHFLALLAICLEANYGENHNTIIIHALNLTTYIT